MSTNNPPNFETHTIIHDIAQRLSKEVSTVIYGQQQAIELLLIGLLAEGHILIEGLPGVAKTTLAKTFAQLLRLDFCRIQLTPDMLPSEITGTNIYDLNTRHFLFKKGPIFTDLLLADEINRTPPKTQSALLEAMEEHQVTADGEKHTLSPLFTVIATLNPIEFEGTFPLPEAQLDRFLLKINMGHPSADAEKEMLKHYSQIESRYINPIQLQPVVSREELLQCRQYLNRITVTDEMLNYILGIVQDTRQNPNVELGCSPRAALALLAASRVYAAIHGQNFVNPDHVKVMAAPVLQHRLILTVEAELDNLKPSDIIRQALNKVPIPR